MTEISTFGTFYESINLGDVIEEEALFLSSLSAVSGAILHPFIVIHGGRHEKRLYCLISFLFIDSHESNSIRRVSGGQPCRRR
jgi:hypothetical protein